MVKKTESFSRKNSEKQYDTNFDIFHKRILEIISTFTSNQTMQTVLDTYTIFYGVFIFMIFVFKWTIWYELKHRLGKTESKQWQLIYLITGQNAEQNFKLKKHRRTLPNNSKKALLCCYVSGADSDFPFITTNRIRKPA